MEQFSAAITNVRSKANSIRTTITQYLEPDLLGNPNPSWPDLLSSFDVVARRMSDLSTDLDPVLNFLAYQPRKPTANSADIPLFLSTRPLAEMDLEEARFVGIRKAQVEQARRDLLARNAKRRRLRETKKDTGGSAVAKRERGGQEGSEGGRGAAVAAGEREPGEQEGDDGEEHQQQQQQEEEEEEEEVREKTGQESEAAVWQYNTNVMDVERAYGQYAQGLLDSWSSTRAHR